MTEWLKKLWCRAMHGAPMHPHHGHYECRQCQRRWPVEWPVGEQYRRETA